MLLVVALLDSDLAALLDDVGEEHVDEVVEALHGVAHEAVHLEVRLQQVPHLILGHAVHGESRVLSFSLLLSLLRASLASTLTRQSSRVCAGNADEGGMAEEYRPVWQTWSIVSHEPTRQQGGGGGAERGAPSDGRERAAQHPAREGGQEGVDPVSGRAGEPRPFHPRLLRVRGGGPSGRDGAQDPDVFRNASQVNATGRKKERDREREREKERERERKRESEETSRSAAGVPPFFFSCGSTFNPSHTMPYNCTARYPKSTDSAILRAKSCSPADDGAFPNRQNCVEECWYDDSPPPPQYQYDDSPPPPQYQYDDSPPPPQYQYDDSSSTKQKSKKSNKSNTSKKKPPSSTQKKKKASCPKTAHSLSEDGQVCEEEGLLPEDPHTRSPKTGRCG